MYPLCVAGASRIGELMWTLAATSSYTLSVLSLSQGYLIHPISVVQEGFHPVFITAFKFLPCRGVPPGARFDPYGPPGVPGFEPQRFTRYVTHSIYRAQNSWKHSYQVQLEDILSFVLGD